MIIKLAILEKDVCYLNRITSVFGAKYSDKFEIYSFTDPNIAMAGLENAKIDVLLANDVFDIDFSLIPKRCAFAYLVDSADIGTENDQRAICKFQKVDLICKQILSLYSEKAGSMLGLNLVDDSTKICIFNSVSGGSGASTIAASAALHYAALNRKTLYLNLERFGSPDCFFSGEGQFDMSDVIFALKSKKTNLSLKLEGCVKQDRRGVFFYSQSKIALDMLELNTEEILRLVTELKNSGSYDYIIIDCDFSLDKDHLQLCRMSHSWIWVGDGSAISNGKIYRAYNALATMEANSESSLINRLGLIYNKFSSKTGIVPDNLPVRKLGGVSRFEHATNAQILEQLYTKEMFDNIV